MTKEIVAKDEKTEKARALMALGLSVRKGNDDCFFVTSYDDNTREGVERRERHQCDAEDNGNDWVNRDVSIVAFTASRTAMPNDTGEIRDVPVLTLETIDGDIFSVFSDTAVQCFGQRLYTHLFDGPLTDKHPIKLKLTRKQSKGERSYYWFERWDTKTKSDKPTK